jgi:hypothetical protein
MANARAKSDPRWWQPYFELTGRTGDLVRKGASAVGSINSRDRLGRGISRRVSIDGRRAFAGGIGRVIGGVVEGNVRMVRSRGRIGMSAAHGKRTTSFSADRAG